MIIFDDDTRDQILNEIKLLASNNYGPWSNKDEARSKVETAVSELKENILEEFDNITSYEALNGLVDEMMED